MFINQFGTRIKPEKCSILCGFAVKSRLLFVIRCHTTSLHTPLQLLAQKMALFIGSLAEKLILWFVCICYETE